MCLRGFLRIALCCGAGHASTLPFQPRVLIHYSEFLYRSPDMAWLLTCSRPLNLRICYRSVMKYWLFRLTNDLSRGRNTRNAERRLCRRGLPDRIRRTELLVLRDSGGTPRGDSGTPGKRRLFRRRYACHFAGRLKNYYRHMRLLPRVGPRPVGAARPVWHGCRRWRDAALYSPWQLSACMRPLPQVDSRNITPFM